MTRYFGRAFWVFAVWLTLSLALHFYSPDPWGAPLPESGNPTADAILQPASATELFIRSVILEIGLLTLLCAFFGAIDTRLTHRVRTGWRAVGTGALGLYALFGHIDREVLRWMGEHMTVSFIRTYTSVGTVGVTHDVLSGDTFWTRIMLIFALLLILPILAALWRIRDEGTLGFSRKTLAIITLSGLLMASVQYVAPLKRRKLHHIDPGIVRITRSALWDALKLDHPKDPATAYQDLIAISRGYPHAEDATDLVVENADYPLWRDDNVGSQPIEQFKQRPLDDTPDILLIVVETWRGWQSGLEAAPLFDGNPKLRALLEEQGSYFPYVHSAGFPSTEGLLGVHLGLWSDPEKVFIIDHLGIRSRALPNILHDAGYHTSALLGFDPAFDNLTPAISRWYEHFEHDPRLDDDEKLITRLIEAYDARDRSQAHLMTLTTRTTHAPYTIPQNTGETPADTSEKRYQQTVRYSDVQIARLIEHLQQQPDWDRTLIVLVGDHAQPTPFQRNQQDVFGRYTPGNTWTSLAFMGGYAKDMPQGRHPFTVSLVDIAPTLLSMLDLRAHNHFVGRDLQRAALAYQKGGAARERVSAWPVLSMNRGQVMWEQGDARSYFSIRNPWRIYLDFDRKNPVEYGQLHPLGSRLKNAAPDDWTVDRWSDAIRAYRMVLKNDGLMPPQE